MESKHEGGCFCGAIRYCGTGSPKRVSACSCRWCQGRTGSVLGVSVYFDKADVVFLQGEPTVFSLTSDAGRWIKTKFCPTCGTTVGWTLEFLPDFHGFAGGTFDDPSFWGDPQRYVFARNKPTWLSVSDHIEMLAAMAGPPAD
ncbi:MAG: GFA family protein [Hyphomicrobiales bacterium]|nr:GFA family protein [Hyphomicrobiales bacterium]